MIPITKRTLPFSFFLLIAFFAGLLFPAKALTLAQSTPSYRSLLTEGVREKYNFNPSWCFKVGDFQGAEVSAYDDSQWIPITLPHAFNEDEAFAKAINLQTDTVVWYRKHFRLPKTAQGKKVFLEFEGIRQGGDFYLNGHPLGFHENGAMAVGFDLTPYLQSDPARENVLAVRIDNSWSYRERTTKARYQWVNNNFNANYGGIPKNVWLHITPRLYQTLPLYSNLQTTGVYIYADKIGVRSQSAIIHAESQVKNETKKTQKVVYEVCLMDRDGNEVTRFSAPEVKVAPSSTVSLKAQGKAEGLHFWSWGYGYLYDVKTRLVVDGEVLDEVITRTGFRKTCFAEGKVWLNDRVLQLKGYAQRSSNEWPAVGMSVPAWLSDFSNGLAVEGNANLVRWMHITPWKQDVESCDRVGLIEAMPAGDAEKDCQGAQWRQRCEVMRDAIIYNRNNPSILFYEGGNESISKEHMVELKQIRDLYDPYGGRAIGSREMLDIPEAEYGGEMLYINKSAHHPLWAMEYSRDEGLRKYWDNWSYPYHREGDGPLYRGADALIYNHNQDELAIEGVRRWYDYYRERPGTGRRVSSGGAKIIFSDSNTHFRGAENYRRSGATDAMRIPKDAFYANQVMWDGWVDVEHPRTHIVGHWNYTDTVVKPVYVVSSSPCVELFLNGVSQGLGSPEYGFLHTFKNVHFAPGTLEAVSYDEQGKAVSNAVLQTVGEPAQVQLHLIQSPTGVFHADGADMVLVEVEVTDAHGQRCPLANQLIRFKVEGPAEWRGGLAQGRDDNYILAHDLPVECGVNRVLLRSTTTAGSIRVLAEAIDKDGKPLALKSDTLLLTSTAVPVKEGLSRYIPSQELSGRLLREETPLTPSYEEKVLEVPIRSAEAGANSASAIASYDDNELSEWRNDGKASTAWITYALDRMASIDDICLKLTGWRMRSYPLQVFATTIDGKEELIWSGETEKSLGYVHLAVRPVRTNRITIRLHGTASESDAFGQIVEVAAPVAGELDLFKSPDATKTGNELRIVEIEFRENLKK